MLKITPNPTFTTEAELHIPGEDLPGKIKVTFRYLNTEQFKSWKEGLGDKPVSEALHEIIVSWSGIEDESGKSVEYSADGLKQLLISYQTADSDITNAYLRELFGARRKN